MLNCVNSNILYTIQRIWRWKKAKNKCVNSYLELGNSNLNLRSSHYDSVAVRWQFTISHTSTHAHREWVSGVNESIWVDGFSISTIFHVHNFSSNLMLISSWFACKMVWCQSLRLDGLRTNKGQNRFQSQQWHNFSILFGVFSFSFDFNVRFSLFRLITCHWVICFCFVLLGFVGSCRRKYLDKQLQLVTDTHSMAIVLR